MQVGKIAMSKHPTIPVFAAAGAILLLAWVAMSGPARADPDSSLDAAVNSARAASTCAALQPDSLVTRAAQMATRETSDYISHRSAVVPFTDPMPALKTIGHTGKKAVLLSGYGVNEQDAIHGLILQGRAAFADCTFARYGVSAQQEDGFVLTSVVLAVP
jgi:hypothetical protein